MSFAQELLWRLELANPGHAYNVPRAARMQGPLDESALQRALDALVARHEALRTTFGEVDGVPRQIVLEPVAVPLARVDLRALPAEERETEALSRVRELTRRPFDLARDLQLRATLVQLAADDHVLLLESHHVVSDTISRNILLRELGALYGGFRADTLAALPSLSVQYGDFAAWQREHFAGERLEDILGYWRRQLAGVPPLELPTDRPRAAARSFEGVTRSATFPPELLDALRRLSQAHGATLFMTLLAAFNVLLARYSGQDDVVVGSPIAGRSHAELEHVIGYFLNTLVLRTSLGGDPTFTELLTRVREAALGAFEHQDVPYEKLEAELRDAGRVGSDALFNVLFALQDPERRGFQLEGTTFVPFGAARGATKFDLFLSMAERPDGLRATIEYRTDLFDAATIDRLFTHLRTLLEGVVARPDERVSRLPLLGHEERARLLVEWNATTRDYPRDVSLVELVRRQAAATPAAPAVSFDGETLSYAELDRRADQLAVYLRDRGVGPEVVVALYVERSVDMVVALLAIHRAGGAYLPLDPSYPRDRLEFMLEDSAAAVLVTERSLRDNLPIGGARVVSLNEERDAIAGTVPEPIVGSTDPDRLAYLIYTSGSTGKPKGVAVTQRNVVNFLVGFDDLVPFAPGATMVAVTPLSFDIAGLELFLPLIEGAHVVVASRETAVNPTALGALCADVSATHLQATPATWRMLVDAGWPGQAGLTALCGGEALPPSLAGELLGRGLTLWNLYGPTEATIWATMHAVTSADAAAEGAAAPIGRPMANVQVYVLDAAGQPAPIGVPGELLIGGVGVARGYHARSELTAERFVPDPFADPLGAPGARLYRTGDRARWRADGVIEFLGRFDHQVKLHGHRIELGEIEHALASQPDVAQAVAIVREDVPGDARLVAYVVPKESATGASAADVVDRWRQVWDEAYGVPDATYGESVLAAAALEPGFNIAGWLSSYDLQPIPAPAMRQYRDLTAERMLAMRPRRVLDIGCGTGLFLFRVAPHCEAYVGVDAAAEALRAVERDPGFAALRGVQLVQAEAHEVGARFAPASFDLVVLNSVVQYFPNVEYLVQVLEQAVPLVAPGGTLFIGDVRSLPLLETFHASVALAHAPNDLPLAELRSRVRHRMGQERELVIDPALFSALRLHLPAVRECRVLPKRGRSVDELSKFRCDVALRIGTPQGDAPAMSAIPAHVVASIDAARALLAERPPVLRLVNVLDQRVAPDLQAHALMCAAAGESVDAESLSVGDEPPRTVGDLRALLAAGHAGAAGLDVEALLTLDDEYEAELAWPESQRPGCADVVLRHRAHGPARAPGAAPRAQLRPWADFVHHAAPETFEAAQLTAWRETLGAQLPDYMVPTAFVPIARLPLTPNGKIDRKALPAPPSDVHAAGASYIAPRTTLEHELVWVWESLLAHRPIGIRDDFFEIGGHSLLAIRMLLEVERVRGRRVPLATLFEHSTIEKLAAVLGAQVQAEGEPPVVVVNGKGTRRPLVFVHGDVRGGGWYCRHLAQHLGDRPIIVLPTLRGDGDDAPTTVEQMAAQHVASLRTVQPVGPYMVGGFCAGGLVAYEIAQQLRAAGERVDLLVVVDTAALNARLRPLAPLIGAVERLAPPARRLDRRAALFRAARYYAWRFDDVRRRSTGDQMRWAGRLVVRHLRGLIGARPAPPVVANHQTNGAGNDPHVGLDERLIANGPASGPGQSVLMFQQRAAVAYVQRPYDGPMHAIWASEVLGRRQREIDPTRGWRRLATSVHYGVVESSHVGLITRNLQAFAERLRAVLDAVDPA